MVELPKHKTCFLSLSYNYVILSGQYWPLSAVCSVRIIRGKCHLALKDAQMKSIHYSQSSHTHMEELKKYVYILFDDH